MPTASLRLKKLLKHGLIRIIGKNFKHSNSLIYGLTKNGFKEILKRNPEMLLIERYQSNSIDHDVKLVEIFQMLSAKKNVQNYWPENVIQCSREFSEDETLSRYREFFFDGLIRYNDLAYGAFIFGLEYECSQKSSFEYREKLNKLYRYKRPQAILYICETLSIENAIKKIEREIVTDNSYKLYFMQYESLIAHNDLVTFVNQKGSKIIIS